MWFYYFVRNVEKVVNHFWNFPHRYRSLNVFPFLSGVMILFLFNGKMLTTKNIEPTQYPDQTPNSAIQSQLIGKQGHYKVTVKATDYAFMAPNEIHSGWITFVLNNEEANNTHELSIGRIPDGVSYQEYLDEYVGAWETVLKEFQDGKFESSEIHSRVDELLPEWSDEVKYLSSRGLVSPGRSAEKTIYMEPGKYTLDCWAKTSDGFIHLSRGMTRPITVTEESANSSEPAPESNITLHQNEIEVNWSASLGRHTFALNLDEGNDGRPVHRNIHLIKLNKDTNLQAVNTWLDWYRIGGLRTPAPVDFLGGVSTYYADAEAGPAYFSVDIDKPGQYAWIVQVEEGKQLWKKFTVE
jgi:hypothetical protein